jgi:hypothetical protein
MDMGSNQTSLTMIIPVVVIAKGYDRRGEMWFEEV